MMLMTKAQRVTLLKNGIAAATRDHDPYPVVKLFTPDAACTWILSELDPDDPDQAFGLADLGMGCPELGYVSLSEIAAVRGKFGLPVERDRYYRSDKRMSELAAQARELGRIPA